MFFDLHVHTAPVSHCANADAGESLLEAKRVGYDGIVLCNHYTKSYFTEESYGQWIEDYIAEWQNCRALGKELGIKVLCGIEVTFEEKPTVHLLIYGADEAFLRENKGLCFYSHKELYALCKKHGCALIQGHPLRWNGPVLDTKMLDGVEINCHANHHSGAAMDIYKIAEDNGLALTAGCDYHADSRRPVGGTFLPDDIENERQLAEYLLTSDTFKVRVDEPETGKVYDLSYTRKR